MLSVSHSVFVSLYYSSIWTSFNSNFFIRDIWAPGVVDFITIASMDKSDVVKLIGSKSERVSFSTSKRRSKVWPNFVLINVNKAFASYVKRVVWAAILRWKSRDETNGLKGHIDSCKGIRLVEGRGSKQKWSVFQEFFNFNEIVWNDFLNFGMI